MRYPGQTSCDVEEQDAEKGAHPGSVAKTWISEKRVFHTFFISLHFNPNTIQILFSREKFTQKAFAHVVTGHHP